MLNRFLTCLQLAAIVLTLTGSSAVMAQSKKGAPEKSTKQTDKKSATKKKKTPPPFKWVNPLSEGQKHKGLHHKTFVSPSMEHEVGYCIYLPPQYNKTKSSGKRFPVVYYLHGGRPGSETKSVKLVPHIHKAMASKKVAPAIYVFVNGGKMSHYNHPESNSQGEDVFVKELIPHVDATYRTIANRTARGVEGFSQGGRGTARIMFRHPDLFISAAPGGGGHEAEKRISEEDGYESPNLRFAPGYNTWDTARVYAKSPNPKLNILVYVGSKGFNYENNLQWMEHLKSLDIPHDHIIIDDAPHSATIIYGKNGLDIMQFHAKNFADAVKGQK
ncbi:MAG: 1,4-beta-xylanase [Blastopirellula sp.]|nr:MAG: 1,4-beta-xylanase [Blastopirellula sp.]